MITKNEKRREEILLMIDRLGYLSRSQIQRIFNLGGVRNTNRILKSMSRYLNSFRAHENVYYLSKAGRELIGSEVVRQKPAQVKHVLMRNELFIEFGCPKQWETEVELKFNNRKLIADVYFKAKELYFAEIDNTQKMIVNDRKIMLYKQLKNTGLVQRTVNTFPTLIWVTTTEKRRQKLENLCRHYELSYKIYTINDLI